MNAINFILDKTHIFYNRNDESIPLISRIYHIAKEIFYFLVPNFAKPKFEVTLAVRGTYELDNWLGYDDAKAILRDGLGSYKWNIIIHRKLINDINLDDYTGQRLMVKIYPGSCGEQALGGPEGLFIHRAKLKPVKLLSFVSENVHFENPYLKDFQNRRIIFLAHSNNRAYQEALQKFVEL